MPNFSPVARTATRLLSNVLVVAGTSVLSCLALTACDAGARPRATATSSSCLSMSTRGAEDAKPVGPGRLLG